MPLPPLDDTITAIATAPGVGAIGVVRLSGPESYRIAGKIFRPKNGKVVAELAAGRAVFGSICDGGELVDEALLLTFKAPHSYTGQDALELQTHGGSAVLRKVLSLCCAHGARLAGPGEFTLRAYLNGRLDLVPAEAVLDIVNASSNSARRSAALGLSKALSEQLDLIQSDLTAVYGSIQAALDYPDEGVPEAEFAGPLRRAVKRLERLLATAKAGATVRRGARLALIGRPNAGKSSLLNALLGYPRALVSAAPGTTRDYLEAPLELGGVPFTAIDTAGIRATADAIEASGVTAAEEIASSADLSLLLLDISQPLTAEDRALLARLEPSRTLVIASKADLNRAWSEPDLTVTAHSVSAKTGEGLDSLKQAVHERLLGDAATSELWITSERHAAALRQTKELLERALSVPDDLAALDLEEALRALAEITGRGDIAEETLMHIFANFCVGK